MLHKPLPVAVIGAGFSGTLTALQLHDRLGGRPILLCERAAQFAKGVAYSTEESVHLLNVRAANMGAYPDRPRGFLDWLETQGRSVDGEVHETPAGSFATRGLFGRYLSSLLRDRIQGKEGAMRLQIVPEEVVELRPSGEGFLMRFAGGRKRRIAGAVLARRQSPALTGKGPRHRRQSLDRAFREGSRSREAGARHRNQPHHGRRDHEALGGKF